MMTERGVLILYGSETGNAQDYAVMLSKKCRRLRLETRLSALDSYDVSQLPFESVVIVVCSTTGQGALPQNGQQFWKFLLRRKLPPTLLTGVRFTTFGLGDSSYPRFNWAIRKIHKRLLQLGACELVDRGEGDEMHPDGVDGHFESWRDLVGNALTGLYPSAEPAIPDDELMEPFYTLQLDTSKLKRTTTGERTGNDKINVSRPRVLSGTVKANSRITSEDHFQDVREFSFSHKGDLSYVPGDTVALYCRNDDSLVSELLEHQGWTHIADFPATVSKSFEDAVDGGLVHPLTLRSLITYHLDISSIPRRSFFDLAWHFSDDPEREQERLKEFSTVDGLEDLYNYANRPRRSIVETITEFTSLKISIEYFLDLVPILRPRLFSIASPSPALDSSGKIDITLAVAIVKYRTIIRRIRKGVCTNWIAQLEVGDEIPFKVFRTPFTPGAQNDPMIMIGPGTGVAPMRSLILTRTQNSSVNTDMLLFFGCRYKDKDFLFERDWARVVQEGYPLKVIPAFSRDGGGYVQDQLYKHKAEIVELLTKKNAYIYVCGSAGKMPRQVRVTIAQSLQEVENWEPEVAEAYVKELEKNGRYLEEAW